MNTINKKVLNQKAVIYCRVSSHEQVTEGNSLTSQEKICKDYTLRSGYDLVKIFIEDESAKTTNRPQLDSLFKFVTDKKNLVNVVVVYKVDRMCRNRDDYHFVRGYLKKHDISLRAASEPFDDSPIGRFMEYTMANIAHLDNDIRTERSVGGMRDAMRQGRYVWIAPLGYSNSGIPGKTNLSKNEKAPIVFSTFDTIAKNTASIEDIRKQKVKEGLTNKAGKPISKSQFYRLLRNQVYAGWIIKFGEKHRGLFEPIVSDDLYEQVQRVLKYRGRRNFQYVIENPDFPLRRFIRHPSGLKLTGSWSTGRSKNKYAYYRFKMKGLEFKKKDLEERFKEFINLFQFDEGQLEKLKVFLQENFTKKTVDGRKESKRIENHINDLRTKQTNLVEKNLNAVISDSILKTQLDIIEQELLKAYSQLAQIPDSKYDFEEVLDFVSEYLQNPCKIWEKAPMGLKLKLQWFQFPKGITFDGTNFGTSEISFIYKTDSFFLTNLSHKAGFMHLPSNQGDINTNKIKCNKLVSDELNLSLVTQELVKLFHIIKGEEFKEN